MLIIFYNIAIFFYGLGIRIYSLFNQKAVKWITGRKNLFETLKKEKFNNTIWFHCASVGEFEQGLPLLNILRTQYQGATFLVTFFSPSGYEFAVKRYANFLIYYLPIDTKKNAIQFIETIRPQAVFFIKYEFWFHYLTQLRNRNIPSYLVSGIFRKEQIFFTRYGSMHRQMLRCFAYIFVQNNESEQLLNGIDIKNVSVLGDTRFDRVAEIQQAVFEDEIITDFTAQQNLFIAGSVWKSDEDTLKKIIQLLPQDWKILIAPHEINTYSTTWLNEDVEYYTRYKKSAARIMVIDTLGILSRLYRKGTIAYIGGGYGKGIHNILEAAIYDIPIFIGPKYQKFNEAVELVQKEIAFDTSKKETETILSQLISNNNFYRVVQERCQAYMSDHANVSAKIAVYLSNIERLK